MADLCPAKPGLSVFEKLEWQTTTCMGFTGMPNLAAVCMGIIVA